MSEITGIQDTGIKGIFIKNGELIIWREEGVQVIPIDNTLVYQICKIPPNNPGEGALLLSVAETIEQNPNKVN